MLKSIFGLVVVLLPIGFATYSHFDHKARQSEYESAAVLGEKEIAELKKLASSRDRHIHSLEFQIDHLTEQNNATNPTGISTAEKRANGKLLTQIANQKRADLLFVAQKDKQISALTMEVMTLKIKLLEGSNETDYINRELFKQLQKEESELQRKAETGKN